MKRWLLNKIDGPGAHTSWASMLDFHIIRLCQNARWVLRKKGIL
jgi:hypothetical protein